MGLLDRSCHNSHFGIMFPFSSYVIDIKRNSSDAPSFQDLIVHSDRKQLVIRFKHRLLSHDLLGPRIFSFTPK